MGFSLSVLSWCYLDANGMKRRKLKMLLLLLLLLLRLLLLVVVETKEMRLYATIHAPSIIKFLLSFSTL